jgi:hypothetical protein
MNETAIRPLTPLFQKFLYLATFLTFFAGVPLFLLPEQTDRFFSWTINPPLTATWLGATFWASSVIVFLASRQPVFARLRPSMPGGLLFVWLMLGATALHLDRFHLDRLTGIAWVVVYFIVPPVLTYILWQQFRAPGGDPPRTAPLPNWLRLAFGLYAVMILIVGIGLYLAPQQTAVIWPWTLTPLTARATAAWLIPLGVIAAQIIWEHDFGRIQATMIGAIVFAILHFLVVVRYAATIDWSNLISWLYLLVLISTLVVGIYGWMAQSTVRPAVPAT